MTRAAFTKAELARAIEVADRCDPPRVVEVTKDGTIRLLPFAAEVRQPTEGQPEEW